MELMHIPLSELSIAKVNVRHTIRKPDYADLVPSIRERGILQPLLVRKNGRGYEIVAGRRRYLAACSLEKEGLEIEAIPCAVMAKGDDAAAVEASLIENVAHLPMDEMDQFEAFNRLLKEGRTVAEIANIFGVTEIMVKRRLAIANLLPKIRQLYRAEEIDSETLRALTMASKQQQKDWLALYADQQRHAPMGYTLKRWLLGGENIPTSAAIFDPSVYDGAIVSDLFGEESFFADGDKFWSLQMAAIEAEKQKLLDKGWSKVEVLERGNRFHSWDYEPATKEKGGIVFITVSDRGEVDIQKGYVSRSEARKRQRKDKGEPVNDKPTKPELTAPMQNYIELHRLAAIRLSLLDHPQIALRLALAHMIAGSSLWQVKPDPQRAAKPEIGASVAASPVTRAFEQRRRDILILAGIDGERSELVRPNCDDHGVVFWFARFLKLSNDDVLRILALAMAETLACGSAASEAAGMVSGASLANWTPDAVFFDLLAGKDVVHAILADVASPTVADGNKGETGKVQKGIIRDCLEGTNGRPKTEKWLPPYLQFPAKGYTDRGGINVVERWQSVAGLFA
jgi:ParB family chromosome partitioning protein